MSEKSTLKNLYWNQDLSLREIANELNLNYKQVYYRFRKKYDIPTHNILWRKLEIDNQELRECLNDKYSNMRKRVEGRTDRKQYEGMELLSEPEFINLCNKNKDRILSIWNKYLESGRDLKYALSLDRIDRSLGYIKSNIQFVVNGFNSWKDHLNPIKLTCQGEEYYFSSPAEASRYFGWRNDDVREVLRGERNQHDIEVMQVSYDKLFARSSCDSLNDYYHNCLI